MGEKRGRPLSLYLDFGMATWIFLKSENSNNRKKNHKYFSHLESISEQIIQSDNEFDIL